MPVTVGLAPSADGYLNRTIFRPVGDKNAAPRHGEILHRAGCEHTAHDRGVHRVADIDHSERGVEAPFGNVSVVPAHRHTACPIRRGDIAYNGGVCRVGDVDHLQAVERVGNKRIVARDDHVVRIRRHRQPSRIAGIERIRDIDQQHPRRRPDFQKQRVVTADRNNDRPRRRALGDAAGIGAIGDIENPDSVRPVRHQGVVPRDRHVIEIATRRGAGSRTDASNGGEDCFHSALVTGQGVEQALVLVGDPFPREVVGGALQRAPAQLTHEIVISAQRDELRTQRRDLIFVLE